MKINEALHHMQTHINCPKKRLNKFAGYHYRNFEDLNEAAKKVLPSGYSLKTSEEVVLVGDRYYVKCTATLSNGEAQESACGYAREALAKKGQDEPQITGTASSYAGKRALGGLLMVDDGVDSDLTNNHGRSLMDVLRDRMNAPHHKHYVEQVLEKKQMRLDQLTDEQISKLLEVIDK